MSEIKQLFPLSSLPGIKRDGTSLDGEYFSDGQWVRFQRGKPKKIGGYKRVTAQLRGPIYNSLVWSKSTLNNIFLFSKSAIEMIQVDSSGGGSTVITRTPSGYTGTSKTVWSVDTMFDAAATSNISLVLALPASMIGDIDDQTETSLYVGDVIGTGVFTAVSDVNAVASGGVYVTSPYAVLYGNNGKVTWSNANEPQNYTTGDAGTARITGSKIIKGMSLRSGGGSGGLLWSLDSVIRQDHIGGNTIFRFSTLSRQSSILSANSVVEYDGSYYWIGIDRFLMCNGSQVVEISNDMNLNWFFDGINKTHSSKVWGMKIPRYGEIWWFFPKGTATECSHAVILNVREKTWYDIELPRTSGYHQQVFNNPIMCGRDTSVQRVLVLTIVSGSIAVGNVLTGGTSLATGTVYAITGTAYSVNLGSTIEFVVGENVTTPTPGSATVVSTEYLYSLYLHERDLNAVIADASNAIQSWFTTADIGLPTGGVTQNQQQGLNRWTRLVRVEPDFVQAGAMTMEVLGKEQANSSETTVGPYTFSPTDTVIDLRTQQRHFRLKFMSNISEGNYEMGRVLLHTEPGDIRS